MKLRARLLLMCRDLVNESEMTCRAWELLRAGFQALYDAYERRAVAQIIICTNLRRDSMKIKMQAVGRHYFCINHLRKIVWAKQGMNELHSNAITALTPRLQNQGDQDGQDEGGTGLATKTRVKTKKPSLYRVLLLNDDFTPMEFVVHVLQNFFSMTPEKATQVMLHVHNNGVGECGVFTYEVAETKVTQVMDFAQKHQHPLQCVMEKK